MIPRSMAALAGKVARRRAAAVAAVALGLVLSGCSVSPGPLVKMTITDSEVVVDPTGADSGRMRYEITHLGSRSYDLALILADDPANLTRNPDGTVDLDVHRPYDTILGLEPGSYAANLPNVIFGDYIWIITNLTYDQFGRPTPAIDEGLWAPFAAFPDPDEDIVDPIVGGAPTETSEGDPADPVDPAEGSDPTADSAPADGTGEPAAG